MTFTYSLTDSAACVLRSDGAVIPTDPNNRDYAAYLAWAAEGNSATDPTTLQDKQDSQWSAIKAERDRRTQTGGYYVSSVSKWFHSDQFSRTQQIGLLMYGASMPSGIQWKTMDGSFVPMTSALAQEIFTAAGLSDQTIFAYAETLRQQVLASSDPMSINVLAGWPKGYGE